MKSFPIEITSLIGKENRTALMNSVVYLGTVYVGVPT